MVDESMITIKGETYWLWIAYEPYIKKLKRLYGSKYTIYTDGASYYN